LGITDSQVINKILVGVLQKQLGDEIQKAAAADSGKVNSLIAEIQERIPRSGFGAEPNAAQLFLFANGARTIGDTNRANRLYRQAEEKRGDEAAETNYDVNEGFNYFDFSKDMNDYAEARMVNYRQAKEYDDILATKDLYFANAYDRSLGGQETNSVRQIVADAYYNTGDMANTIRTNNEITAGYQQAQTFYYANPEERENLEETFNQLRTQAQQAHELNANVRIQQAQQAMMAKAEEAAAKPLTPERAKELDRQTKEGYKNAIEELEAAKKIIDDQIKIIDDPIDRDKPIEDQKEALTEDQKEALKKLEALKESAEKLGKKVGKFTAAIKVFDLKDAIREAQIKMGTQAAAEAFQKVQRIAEEIIKNDPENEAAYNILASVSRQTGDKGREILYLGKINEFTESKLQKAKGALALAKTNEDQRALVQQVARLQARIDRNDDRIMVVGMETGKIDLAIKAAKNDEQRAALEAIQKIQNGDMSGAISGLGIIPKELYDYDSIKEAFMERFKGQPGAEEIAEKYAILMLVYDQKKERAEGFKEHPSIKALKPDATDIKVADRYLEELRSLQEQEKPTDPVKAALLDAQIRKAQASFATTIVDTKATGKDDLEARRRVLGEAKATTQIALSEIGFLESIDPATGELTAEAQAEYRRVLDPNYVTGIGGISNTDSHIMGLLNSQDATVRSLVLNSLYKEGDFAQKMATAGDSSIKADYVIAFRRQAIATAAELRAQGRNKEADDLVITIKAMDNDIKNAVQEQTAFIFSYPDEERTRALQRQKLDNLGGTAELVARLESGELQHELADQVAGSIDQALRGFVYREGEDKFEVMQRNQNAQTENQNSS